MNHAGPNAKRAAAFDKLVAYIRDITEPSARILALPPGEREKWIGYFYRQRGHYKYLLVADIRKKTGLSPVAIRSVVEDHQDDLLRATGAKRVTYDRASYKPSGAGPFGREGGIRHGGWRMSSTNPASITVWLHPEVG